MGENSPPLLLLLQFYFHTITKGAFFSYLLSITEQYNTNTILYYFFHYNATTAFLFNTYILSILTSYMLRTYYFILLLLASPCLLFRLLQKE